MLAGRRFWELSGGIFRCAQCGRALVAVTSLKGPKERRRRMFYYICPTRRQRGKHACSFSRSMNAQKAEAAVWDAVTALLTNPENLKSDLGAMIERGKETRGDQGTAPPVLHNTRSRGARQPRTRGASNGILYARTSCRRVARQEP